MYLCILVRIYICIGINVFPNQNPYLWMRYTGDEGGVAALDVALVAGGVGVLGGGRGGDLHLHPRVALQLAGKGRLVEAAAGGRVQKQKF